MSTKTTFKRIALATVAALGFGMLSSAPSNAAYLATDTSISVSAVGRVNVGVDFVVTSNAGSGVLDTSDEITIKVLSGPSSAANGCIDADRVLATTCSEAAAGTKIGLMNDSLTVRAASGQSSYISLTQDANQDTYGAGTYRFLVWVGGSPSQSVPEHAPTSSMPAVTVTVTLGSVPTSFALTSSSATAESSTGTSALVEGTITDAAGVATLLTSNETFVVTSGGAGYEKALISDTNTVAGGGSTPNATIDSTAATGVIVPVGTRSEAIQQLKSKIRFWVGSNSASTTTFSIIGQQNLTGVNSSAFTLTLTNPAKITGIEISSGTRFGGTRASESATGVLTSAYAALSAYAEGSAAGEGAAVPVTGALFASTSSGKSVSFEVTTSAAGLVRVAVASAGTNIPLPAGVVAGTYDYTSDTVTTVKTFTATAPTPGDAYKVTFNWGNNKSSVYTVTYKAPEVASGVGSVSTNFTSGATAVVGSTNTLQVTVLDAFSDEVSGATVRVTHNRTATGITSDVLTATTNADGVASFSIQDAFAGTTTKPTNSTGSFTITASTANAQTSASTTATLAYQKAEWLVPGSITITESANDDDTVGNLPDADIWETITVTSETGTVMAGMAYSATISDGLYETTATSNLSGFLNSAGQARLELAGFKSGVQTVTFTVGSLTKSDTFTVISGASKLRALSVDKTTLDVKSGETGYVTVTAKDIYGNVVPAASLTVAYTGTTGRIVSYNGAAGNTATTDANGVVVVGIYADGPGTGTLTASYSGAVAATVTTTAQGVAPIARAATVSTAVTTSGTSAAVAAAEAATDAAAEAIDAANAATDAANLAAEAADAATVAAEEARDAADAATAAVEELATQVATLMAALKAQITTLANTVAKIAKKVKA
jgi:hypothetical protein